MSANQLARIAATYMILLISLSFLASYVLELWPMALTYEV